MSDEINKTLEGINRAFEELKSTNEQKLAEMVSKGAVDSLLETKLAAISEEISELQKKAARPALESSASENDPEYKAAWTKWARQGEGEAALKAMTKAANPMTTEPSSAGVAVPRTVEAGIYTALTPLSPLRQLATVVTVSSSDYNILVSDDNVGGGWVGQKDARPQTDSPLITEINVPIYEVYANPFVSQTSLDDLSFNVEASIASATAKQFAKAENAAFLNGTGVKQPVGIMKNTDIASVKTGKADGFAANGPADVLINAIYALGSGYRQNASILMASTTEATVRTLKDANGIYLWQPSLVLGAPATLAGRPIYNAEEMDAVAADKLPILIGDFAVGMEIVDRVGIRTLRDPYSNKPFVSFYSTKRVGFVVRDAKAFVMVKVAA